MAAVLAPVYLEADVRHLAAAPDAKVFPLLLQRMSLANAPYLCADTNYTRILLYNSKYCKILAQGYKVRRLSQSILNVGKSIGTKVAVAGCTLLILVSIGIFVQQTPGVTGNAKIYDSDYADVLRAIGDDLPAGEVVVASANGPQAEYYTGREIKIPRGVDSLKSLVEYMWRNNSTHLIVFVRQSSEEMLGPVFSRSGVQSLDKPFEKVGQYTTETADTICTACGKMLPAPM